MTHTVKLKKRYLPDGDKRHWAWVLRYWSADAVKEISEVIGWYAPARDPWTPRCCKGPRLTEKQAEEIRTQRRNDLREGRVGQPEPARHEMQQGPSSMQFSKWIKLYVEETKGTVRSTTLKEIHDALKALDATTSTARAADVNHQTVKRFIQARLKKGVRRSTVLKQISSLRRVWYDADIQPNPWANPKLRRQLRSAPKDWHLYSPEEYGQLMAKCDEWSSGQSSVRQSGRKWLAFKAMITLAYSAGLRLGEIDNLTWPDVDLDAGEIEVAPKSANGTTIPWEPKDHERRIVPLTATMKAILLQVHKTVDKANPYVFVSAERYAHVLERFRAKNWNVDKPLTNDVRRDFRSLCKAAGVPVCTFHSLRKSCCTHLLEGNVAPHTVRKIMGHASLETTIKYYSKVRRDQIAIARGVAESYSTPQKPGDSSSADSS